MSYREEKLEFNDLSSAADGRVVESEIAPPALPTLSDFLLAHGRLPHSGDAVKPWQFKGWLVPYIQQLEGQGKIPARYDYVLRTIENGALLAGEEIPQIEFLSEFEPSFQPGLKMFKKLLDEIYHRTGGRMKIYELCEWLGFALGVTDKPSEMDDDLQLFLYQNFDYRQILMFAGDYLGHLLSESEYGKRRGFYPTPFDLCELKWRIMTIGANWREMIPRSAYDPAVGTGRLLLVASNNCLRLFGQEIDATCCLITKINLALYAPWNIIPKSFFGE